MQTSGMAPQFSDGTKKTVTSHMSAAPKPTKPAPMLQSFAKGGGSTNTHRRGGHAKHAKGGR